MQLYLSVFVAVIGMVVYLAATNPKAAEIGRCMFLCGLLVFLFTFNHVVSLGK